MHRNNVDSCKARQCILSDSTVFPLPPYGSSTNGLAYDITLTKADGNSGVLYWCDFNFDSLWNEFNLTLLKDFRSLKYLSISSKQYVCHHVRAMPQPRSFVVLTSLAFNQGPHNKLMKCPKKKKKKTHSISFRPKILCLLWNVAFIECIEK